MTQQLFADKSQQLELTPTQHDTFEITEIYLQRPVSISSLALSKWFCLAHGLHDWNLLQAASLGDCKRQMIDKKYTFLSLEPLRQFNALHAKKGGRDQQI